MSNSLIVMAKMLRTLPENELVTYPRLATIFEELGKMQVNKNHAEKFYCRYCGHGGNYINNQNEKRCVKCNELW